jgi:hypothetical protein
MPAKQLFAFQSKGRLVLKLPADRVAALASSGDGEPFDPGHGRVMKEWIAIDLDAVAFWSGLAREALEFAAGHAPLKTSGGRRAAKGSQRAPRRR